MKLSTSLREWDMPLLVAALLLCVVSLVALRSATATLNPALVSRQAFWIVCGMLACCLVAAVPYSRWIDVGAFLYVGVMFLLLIVLLTGTMKLGATRWLTIFGFSLQPSELAKLSTACWLARLLANQPTPIPSNRLMLSACVAGLPAGLIFLQPDLGSASVLGAMWLATVWAAGLSSKRLAVFSGVSLAMAPLGWAVMKDYQRTRLAVFLNPHEDPLGAGYTIIQSQIAIGSGQLLGRGWMAGTQNQLNFLPERHADFLFSVIGEEWGFIGSVAVVLLMGGLVWRALHIGLQNSDPHGRLLAVGLTAWIGYQATVNMGMVMRMVPVVGVPLPFVSYGGSAMLTSWIAIGLLQSLRRFGTRF